MTGLGRIGLAPALAAALFCGHAAAASTGPEGDKLATEGVRLVREGKVEEGIGLILQASRIHPNDPALHVKLGGLLYEYAQNFFGAGEGLRAQMVLRDAERELRAALELLPDSEARLRADCAFLLGEIYVRGYGYREAAKPWYERALRDNPEHAGAHAALNGLDTLALIAPEELPEAVDTGQVKKVVK